MIRRTHHPEMKSRWTDDQDDVAADAEGRREKEEKKKKEKKRAKAERQRRLEEAGEGERHLVLEEDGSAAEAIEVAEMAGTSAAAAAAPPPPPRPAKRRKLSSERANASEETESAQCLRFAGGEWGPCRHVDNYEKLNHIEEGSYGWVSRAKDMATGEVVALKKLKMENANDGLPVTGLREIQTLMESRHPHIVHLKEVVVGINLSEYGWHRIQDGPNLPWSSDRRLTGSCQRLSGHGIRRA